MKKPQIIGGVSALVLAILFYLVLSNSHIDIFPGVEYVYDYQSLLHTENGGMISLLDHSRGFRADGDYEKLNAIGYIVAFIVVVGIPAGIGYFISKKLGAKK